MLLLIGSLPVSESGDAMQGRSLVAGMEKKGSGGGSNVGAERIVRDRLAGLGYV